MDPTEQIRRELTAEINSNPLQTREDFEAAHGQVWDTNELSRDFDVQGFAAPFVIVRRKADGQRGSLEFKHHPRFYYGFTPINK